ncbi:MAG TPA: hypothetical protein PL131_05090 [Methylotenera sp.]|nr:hypothetical protein [Methylotenera sp.]HPH05229.1 hypothetical protein [Methylotenera sp.]HPN00131.1 hypothetical protein [Methylotenera sp.]
MHDHVKFFTKTAAAAFACWALIFAGGLLATAMIAYIFSVKASQASYNTLYLVLSSLAFLAIYFIVANKTSLSFILSRLFDEKLSSVLGEKVCGLIQRFSEKQPNWAQSLKNGAALKDKLLDSSQQDSSLNKIQRKAIAYGLKKINLDDIDFKQENSNLPQIVSDRLMLTLSETAKHSYGLFWVVASAQSLLMLAVLAYNLKWL